MANNPLDNLRDIHLPPAVSFWPLAPGWIILVLIICGSIVGLFYYLHLHKQHLARRIALQELALLRHRFHQQKDNAEILSELSSLLRRAALAKFPRFQVAGLEGKAWLEFLNQQGKTQFFTSKTGEILITAPYQRQPTVAIEPLFDNIALWFKRCL